MIPLSQIHLANISINRMKWSAYNQSLVRRGEILLGFDVVNNWDKELKEMNKDKVGLGAISLSQYISSFTRICQSVLSFAIQANGRNCIRARQGKSTFHPRLHYNKQKNKQVGYQDKRR